MPQDSKSRFIPTLQVDVSPFVPRLSVYYNYHQILKIHHFIRDVSLVSLNQEIVLKIER
jgi:hypothetical protein